MLVNEQVEGKGEGKGFEQEGQGKVERETPERVGGGQSRTGKGTSKAAVYFMDYAVDVLKKTGVVNAYEQFLRSICKNGLP